MKKFLILFLLTSSSLFSQADFWSHYSLDIPIYKLVNYDDSVFIAVSNYEIFRSTNKGLDWNGIYVTPDTCQYSTRLYLYERQINSGEVYLIVNQVNGSSACVQPPVYFSTNSGQSWQELIYPGGWLGDVKIDSFGKIYIRTDTLYKSLDNGINWVEVNTPVYNDYWLGVGMTIDDDDQIYLYRGKRFWIYDPYPVYTWMEGRMYRSNNGGIDWQNIFDFWDEDGINKIFNVSVNNILFGYNDRNLTHHFGNGYNRIWPLEDVNGAIFDDNIIKCTSSSSEGISFSSDNGITWSQKNLGLPNNWTYSLIRDSLGYLYTGTVNGIFKSTGSSFNLSNINIITFEDTRIGDTTYNQIALINPLNFSLNIDSMKFQSEDFFLTGIIDSVLEPGNNNSVVLGFSPTQFGELSSGFTIYTDIIEDEIELFGPSPVPTLISVPFNNNFGDVQIGDTASLTINFTSKSINTLRIDSIYVQSGQYFFINQLEYPVYLNNNDTISLSVLFIPLTQSILPKQDNIVIISNSLNSPLYLIVKGRGVNPNVVEYEDNIITYFLSECYPNPFNPNTTIEYQVPKTSKIKICVYNLVGEEIVVLVNEEKTQGNYKVEFDGSKLSSGVYFYKMQTEEFTSTKKFVLMK